jgi:hypothetical protein
MRPHMRPKVARSARGFPRAAKREEIRRKAPRREAPGERGGVPLGSADDFRVHDENDSATGQAGGAKSGARENSRARTATCIRKIAPKRDLQKLLSTAAKLYACLYVMLNASNKQGKIAECFRKGLR